MSMQIQNLFVTLRINKVSNELTEKLSRLILYSGFEPIFLPGLCSFNPEGL